MDDKLMTLDELRAEVKRLDPKLAEDKPAFETAIMLLASAQLGPDVNAIADFMGIEAASLEERAGQLRKAGIWTDDALNVEWWDEEAGTVAFWLDVCVAEGYVARKQRE